MKHAIKIISLLITALLVGGCGYDGIGLEGKWNLISSGVPDPPSSHDITPGTVTWTFDEGARKIFVEDATDPHNRESEILNYTLLKMDTLVINNERTLFAESNLGYIYLTKDNLEITKTHEDGPYYIFIRNTD